MPAMQAIKTQYHGPTNTRGSRIYARCGAGRTSVEYDHALSLEENHRTAFVKLRDSLGWGVGIYGDAVAGVFNGDFYWVFPGLSPR